LIISQYCYLLSSIWIVHFFLPRIKEEAFAVFISAAEFRDGSL